MGGARAPGPVPVSQARATPACTSFRRGKEPEWDGSRKLLMMYACLIPARYVFKVVGANPAFAMAAVKQ